MAERHIVQSACENILRIITVGKEEHVLRQQDEVLLLGDHKDLSPLYTLTLSDVISNWQGTSENVHVKFLPEKRPIIAVDEIDPEITDLAKRADVVIVTYSNPGQDILHTETTIMTERFFDIVFGRRKTGSLRLYVVAARPALGVLKALADSSAIKYTNRLSKLLMSYLKRNAGNEMTVYTPDMDDCKDPLRFIIPSEERIAADYFEVQEPVINIPSGEVYFEPKPGTGRGTLTFIKGSYYSLNVPIQGGLEVEFSGGSVSQFRDVLDEDKKVFGYLQDNFATVTNRHLAEMGIGTNIRASEIPTEDMMYNRTVLEKLRGFHVAYGDSTLLGGNNKAVVHIDNWFTYGDVFVGNEHLIANGTIRENIF